MRRPNLRIPLVALAISGCVEASEPVVPETMKPSTEILDAAHNHGYSGFFFLSPLVETPPTTGAFDSAVAAYVSVDICEWTRSGCGVHVTTYTTLTGPGSETLRVVPEEEHAVVNWHTDQFTLSTDATYRIRVLVAGTQLGHADVVPVSSGKELKNVDTEEYISLLDGRTLPIKFRIEPGAVFLVGVEGAAVIAADGAVTLTIPEGALAGPTGVTVQPARSFPTDSTLVDGSVYALAPTDLSLAQPANLQIRYDPTAAPDDVQETDLRPHRAVAEDWTEVFHSSVDPSSDLVRGTIDRLGIYGALRKRPVESVVTNPDSTQILVGDTQRVIAIPRDSLGNALNRRINWATIDPTVASVDSGGLVHAIASGRTRVVASSEDRSGNAVVVTRNPIYPNEPPGFTAMTERTFESTVESGWRSSTDGGFTIVSDSTAPHSPPWVGQARFPAGFPGGFEPMWSEFGDFSHLGYRRLYLSFWIKVSENWQGHDSFVNKIGAAWIHKSSVFVPIIFGKDDGALRSEIRLQAIPIVVARNLEPNLALVEIVRGQWHRWEVLAIANTGDDADGEVHWWVDGVKVGEYTDVMLGDSTQSDLWEFLMWRPVWGGVHDAVIAEMHMWMDHLYASGAP